MNRRTKAKGRCDDGRIDGREMSVDEAADGYANEWTFMEVTERDEHDAPQRGIVLDHNRRPDQIQPTIMNLIEELKASTAVPEHVRGYYVSHGVRLLRTAAEREEHKRRTGLFGGGRDRGGG